MVCLAASRKTGGRCIAGKDIKGNTWIRPVGSGNEDAIDNIHSKYADGTFARVLDVIEIQFSAQNPKQHQTENILITGAKWIKRGELSSTKLEEILDDPESLWANWNSSYNGKNDRIDSMHVKNIHNSLYLISTDCTINIKIEGKDFNDPHKRIRCSFQYAGTDFKLPVTDPLKEQAYLAKPEGNYFLGKKCICVSLGPIHDGHAYLFAAAIL
jgi:hypothetical protein